MFKKNYDFWKNKFERNVERDKKNYDKLESMGIKVIVVWGCAIKQMVKDQVTVVERIDNLINEIIN